MLVSYDYYFFVLVIQLITLILTDDKLIVGINFSLRNGQQQLPILNNVIQIRSQSRNVSTVMTGPVERGNLVFNHLFNPVGSHQVKPTLVFKSKLKAALIFNGQSASTLTNSIVQRQQTGSLPNFIHQRQGVGRTGFFVINLSQHQ